MWWLTRPGVEDIFRRRSRARIRSRGDGGEDVVEGPVGAEMHLALVEFEGGGEVARFPLVEEQ